jgi:hypothetical protein
VNPGDARELLRLRLRLGMLVVEVGDHLLALEGKLDHIHDDVVALRERFDVPHPRCYPTAQDQGADARPTPNPSPPKGRRGRRGV